MKKTTIIITFLFSIVGGVKAQDQTINGNLKVGGNASVGTASNDAVFEVNKSTNLLWTAKFKNGGGYSKGVLFSIGSSNNDTTAIIEASDASGNIKMRVNSNGKIGIGTAEPTALLDIVKDVNTYWTTRIKNGGGSAKGFLVEVGNSSSASTIMQLADYSGNVKMKVIGDGTVSIGTDAKQGKLEVNGAIRSKEVKIEVTGWSDFVFDESYKLPSLKEVEQHITDKKHLPGIPSEKEVLKDGVNVVDMQAKLLQKIEELTLYVIELKKENEIIKEKLIKLEK